MKTNIYKTLIFVVLATIFTSCFENLERPTRRGEQIYSYYDNFCCNVKNEFMRAVRLTDYVTLQTESEKQLWQMLYYPDCNIWATAGNDTLAILQTAYGDNAVQCYAIGNGVALNDSTADSDWTIYAPPIYQDYGFTNRDNWQAMRITHQTAEPYVWLIEMTGTSNSKFGALKVNFRIEATEPLPEMRNCQISGEGIILGACEDAQYPVLQFQITQPLVYNYTRNTSQYNDFDLYYRTPHYARYGMEFQEGTIELLAKGTTANGVDSTAVTAKWAQNKLSISYAGVTEIYE